MTFTLLLLALPWLLGTSIVLWGTWLGYWHFKTVAPHLDAPFGLYPISILKPLKGVDHDSEVNLAGFFHQQYPEYELIFSVAEADDPICPLVRKLMRKYPHVPARLIVGAEEIGPNPKVNNLVKSYERARYDLVLISDSNVRVGARYLTHLAAHLDNDVGLVTAVVAGRSAHGLGGLLEAMILNTFYARGMFLAWWYGRPSVIGKSMLFRRSTAARFGGIRNLGRYLAEDFIAGEAFRHLGLKVVLTSEPVEQHIGSPSISAFWSRHLRWGRIRKVQAPLIFAIEPLLGSVGSGILGAIAFQGWLGISPGIFLPLHFTLLAACDFFFLQKLGNEPGVKTPLVWLLREFLALPLWLHIASGNTVNWRGQVLRLLPDGTLKQTT